MSRTLLLLAIIALLGCRTLAKRPKVIVRRVMRVDWAAACEVDGNALSCTGVRVDVDRTGTYLVSANCTIARRVAFWRKLTIRFETCRDVVSNTTCQHIMSLKYNKNVCAIALEPSAPWADFVHKIQPPVRCPLHAGNYSCQNVKVDSQKFIGLIPSYDEKTLYHIIISLFETDSSIHTCIDGGLRVIRVQ